MADDFFPGAKVPGPGHFWHCRQLGYEPPQPPSRPMTHDSAGADGKHGCHPSCLEAEQRVPNGVHAARDLVQGPATKASLDLVGGHPKGQKLPAGDYTVLPLGQSRDPEIGHQTWTLVTLGAYIAPNVARVGISGRPRLHEPNAAGAQHVSGALKRAFLQRKEAPARRYRLWL